jgi:hypothetical protein
VLRCIYMVKNLGSIDRVIRISIGLLFVLFGWYSGSGMAILGGIFALYEGFASWCVVYQLFGINTCPVKQKGTIQVQQIGRIFIQGITILFVAIILNIVANLVGWSTWYTFLQSPTKVLTLDNYIFLFFLYPVSLGMSAEMASKLLSSASSLKVKK